MVKLIKNFKKVLPFKWKSYDNFLDEDFDEISEWKEVSIQLNVDEKININTDNISILEFIFSQVVSILDDGSYWVLNLTFNNVKWFTTDAGNLPALKNLFIHTEIGLDYTDGILMKKKDLLKYGRELIAYPVLQQRRELDIAHKKLPFIIKFTNHFEINLLSTDEELLKKMVTMAMSDKIFIKQYRGTELKINI